MALNEAGTSEHYGHVFLTQREWKERYERSIAKRKRRLSNYTSNCTEFKSKRFILLQNLWMFDMKTPKIMKWPGNTYTFFCSAILFRLHLNFKTNTSTWWIFVNMFRWFFVWFLYGNSLLLFSQHENITKSEYPLKFMPSLHFVISTKQSRKNANWDKWQPDWILKIPLSDGKLNLCFLGKMNKKNWFLTAISFKIKVKTKFY